MNTTTSAKPAVNTRILVINALFIALTLVATMLIQFQLPVMSTGGLIHLGNLPLLVASFVYGKRTGAIAGAFGMGLFDILSSWAIWAPFTFVISGAMGYVAGLIAEKMPGKRVYVYSFAVFVALVIKVVGYYFAEVLLLQGNWIIPFGSIAGNFMQVAVAGAIAIPLVSRLKKSISRF